MSDEKTEYHSGVTSREAQALYRVLDMMCDDKCPLCGYSGFQNEFSWTNGNERCPKCSFMLTWEEVEDIRIAYGPFLELDMDVLYAWREKRATPE
jgi:hypothetical protein